MFSPKVFKVAKPAKRHGDKNDTTKTATTGR
jgi:hypothetical protein